MSYSIFNMLNLILSSYNSLPVQSFFLNSLQIQIVQIHKENIPSTLQPLNLSKQDYLCLKSKFLFVVKLHSPKSLTNIPQILEQLGIVISREGNIYFHSFNQLIKEDSIQCVVIPSQIQLTHQDLDLYLSIIQPFVGHLNLKALSYRFHTIEPFINMFQTLDQVPQYAYYKSLAQTPQRVSLSHLTTLKGQYFSHTNLECWYNHQPQQQYSQIYLLHHNFPIVNDKNQSLLECPSILKNYKFVESKTYLGSYRLVGKTKGRMKGEKQVGNFNCIINYKCQIKESKKILEKVMDEMMRELYMMGIGNYKCQLMVQNYQDIKLICGLFELDEKQMVARFLL